MDGLNPEPQHPAGNRRFTLAYTFEEPGEGMRAFKDKRRPNWSPG
ncbi:MAG: hypothetical protein ACRERE_34760 [Candidatus Entotheonellia bacterium]